MILLTSHKIKDCKEKTTALSNTLLYLFIFKLALHYIMHFPQGTIGWQLKGLWNVVI